MNEEEYTLEILLREVGKVHSNKINKILNKVNMHSGQPKLIHILSKSDGIPQATLSKEMAIMPATVSAMARRMEKSGFVIRKRDALDERVSNVYLTDLGRSVNAQLSSLQTDMDELVFKNFSEAERINMKKYLERILDNLND